MSVNLSPIQLAQSDIVAQVADALGGMAGYRLTLELTESAFINDFEKTKATLLALKRIGVNLALDDFGTGYSSLSYLYQLPFDYLKIDQSFIRDQKNSPIVLAILEMANKLNLMTVAEGVETPEQMAFLEAHGCDVIQGYYFSRPMPLPDLTRFAEKPPYEVASKPRIKRLSQEDSDPLLAWSFTFETGHAEIDAQHKELVLMLNRFHASIRSGRGGMEPRSAMKALIEHVRAHFSFEEKLMHDSRYPDVESHQLEHVKMAAILASYDLQLKASPQMNLQQLLASLQNWLMQHILEYDKKHGEYLCASRSHEAPTDSSAWTRPALVAASASADSIYR